jgi:toxin ParE1/3/4
MAIVTRRPQAELDILEIWAYIAGDSVTEADKWVDRLDKLLGTWATQPMMGLERPELAPNLRSLPFGRYIVFSEPLPELVGIDVIRVMHGSMDIEHRFSYE